MTFLKGITSNGREKILPEPRRTHSTGSYLWAVEKLFTDNGFCDTGTYELILIDRYLSFRKVQFKNEPYQIVSRMTSDEVNVGLTSRRWSQINYYLCELISKEELCQKILKP